MKNLIYNTLVDLANQAPEQHAEIRQNLYQQLDLPCDKQFALYTLALGPASSGLLDNDDVMNNVAESAVKLFEIPEY